jgi:hypothetical protein
MAFAFNQAAFEEVEFKTLDQLTLRARLYPASKRGPALIMNPGVRETITHGSLLPSFPPGPTGPHRACLPAQGLT